MVFKMCFPKSGGNNLARSSEDGRRRNEEIEKMIRRDKKRQARQVKILLLGGSLWQASKLQYADLKC